MSELQKSEIINPETMGAYMGELMSSLGDLANAYTLIQSNMSAPILGDYQSAGDAQVYYGKAIEELSLFASSLEQNVGRLINLIYTLYQYMAKNVEAANLMDAEMMSLLERSMQVIEKEN